MTISTGPSRLAYLATLGYENNPFLTGAGLYTSQSVTVGGGSEDTAAENAYSGTTFDPWVSTLSSTAVVWRVDFGSAVTPTAGFMAAHNLGDLGGSVHVRYSDDNVTYTETEAGNVTPADNSAIGFRFLEGAHRYWEWRFYGLSASDVLSVGTLWLGSEIIMPQRIYQGYRPPLTPTVTELNTNVSEGAHLLGSDFSERGSTFEASFSHLTPDFVRGATWQAFQRRWNRGNGAFWAWRPAKYGDLFYAWNAGGVVAPANSGPKDYMSLTISGRLYHE